MKKNFMIIAVAVLLVGALAFVGTSPVMACGDKATKNSASSTCGSKANAKTASTTDDAKVVATNASAKSADCAATCASKANAKTASAKSATCNKSKSASLASGSSCGSKSAKATNASYAGTKECADSKAACVNWLMANKDMTQVQAEAAYQHCEKSKTAAAAGVELASAEKAAETKIETESSSAPAGSSN